MGGRAQDRPRNSGVHLGSSFRLDGHGAHIRGTASLNLARTLPCPATQFWPTAAWLRDSS